MFRLAEGGRSRSNSLFPGPLQGTCLVRQVRWRLLPPPLLHADDQDRRPAGQAARAGIERTVREDMAVQPRKQSARRRLSASKASEVHYAAIASAECYLESASASRGAVNEMATPAIHRAHISEATITDDPSSLAAADSSTKVETGADIDIDIHLGCCRRGSRSKHESSGKSCGRGECTKHLTNPPCSSSTRVRSHYLPLAC